MLTKLYVELKSFKDCREGVTAIEYAIVAVAIAGIAAAVFSSTGDSGLIGALNQAMTTLEDAVTPAAATPTPPAGG